MATKNSLVAKITGVLNKHKFGILCLVFLAIGAVVANAKQYNIAAILILCAIMFAFIAVSQQ